VSGYGPMRGCRHDSPGSGDRDALVQVSPVDNDVQPCSGIRWSMTPFFGDIFAGNESQSFAFPRGPVEQRFAKSTVVAANKNGISKN